MEYTVVSNVPNNVKLQGSIKGAIWPEFMFHDPIASANWLKMFDAYPEFQLTLLNGDEVIGIANSMPCTYEGPFEQLPDEGWDWAITKGMEDVGQEASHNLLVGLQIAINVNHMNKGISYLILQEMLKLAKRKNLPHVAIPVRPNLKSRYPLIPMERFVTWTREDGLPLDPWLRVHVRSGGRIIRTCSRSTYIPGTIAEWEAWTNMKFPETGDYIIDGALAPVKMDTAKNLGEYVEPNVWLLYKV